jgi:type VI secretion system Hcp family effector
MAIDAYMAFQTYDGNWLKSESQVVMVAATNTEPLMGAQPVKFPDTTPTAPTVFEIEDFSFDIEQTLNIGSQSKGAGAGKVTFNPFSITRKIDRASPQFFQMACSGTAFQLVTLALRKSAGGVGTGDADVSGKMFLRFDFKLVAVKTVSWSYDDESPKEEVTFEYGGLQVRYNLQNPDGTFTSSNLFTAGWNRVNNKSDTGATLIT